MSGLLPDLSRTKTAIDAYDAADWTLEQWLAAKPSEAIAKGVEMERLGEAVGAAFGEDTKDRNDPETCRECVRPGPKNPQHGSELSFVRKCVADWEKQSG